MFQFLYGILVNRIRQRAGTADIPSGRSLMEACLKCSGPLVLGRTGGRDFGVGARMLSDIEEKFLMSIGALGLLGAMVISRQ
jgi:hypothetical protein